VGSADDDERTRGDLPTCVPAYRQARRRRRREDAQRIGRTRVGGPAACALWAIRPLLPWAGGISSTQLE
jgi:hypothetical protein